MEDQTFIATFEFNCMTREEARLIFRAMQQAFNNNTNAVQVRDSLVHKDPKKIYGALTDVATVDM